MNFMLFIQDKISHSTISFYTTVTLFKNKANEQKVIDF